MHSGPVVQSIKSSSPRFGDVLRLHKENSQTLGFLPQGAFRKYADDGTLLVVLDSTQKTAGYLLYRLTRNSASIIHLCTSIEHRTRDMAPALVDELKARTRNCLGISLLCRSDYPASALWKRLEFRPVVSKLGRSRSGSVLVKWWYDHGHPALFGPAGSEGTEPRVPVVIDACVLIARGDPQDAGHEEAIALWADWLQPLIQLQVTHEIIEEIKKGPNPVQTKRYLDEAVELLLLPTPRHQLEAKLSSLKARFPKMACDRNLPDLRHVAETVVNSMDYFVTQDGKLLRIADDVLEHYGLRILTPTDLVAHLHELQRAEQYRPERVAGSSGLHRERVHSGQENELAARFQCEEEGEKKSGFLDRLRSAMRDTSSQECRFVKGSDGSLLAMVAYDCAESGRLRIPLLRVSRGSQAPTLARYLVSQAVTDAAKRGKRLVLIDETLQRDVLPDAAEEAGFIRHASSWIKLIMPESGTVSEILERLEHLATQDPALSQAFEVLACVLRQAHEVSDTTRFSLVEHMLWPLKILDSGIPSFIVPIQPRWAQHLFDEELASQGFFGADANLALTQECVYYRHRLNDGGLSVPGRILWYVSLDKKYRGSKSMRACSRLTGKVTGQPGPIFREFKRLGVYRREHLKSIASKDRARGELMALTFDDTQLFEHPLMFSQIQAALEKQNCRPVLRAPMKITAEAFAALYRACTGQKLG